jgi:hypothetical protein
VILRISMVATASLRGRPSTLQPPSRPGCERLEHPPIPPTHARNGHRPHRHAPSFGFTSPGLPNAKPPGHVVSACVWRQLPVERTVFDELTNRSIRPHQIYPQTQAPKCAFGSVDQGPERRHVRETHRHLRSVGGLAGCRFGQTMLGPRSELVPSRSGTGLFAATRQFRRPNPRPSRVYVRNARPSGREVPYAAP